MKCERCEEEMLCLFTSYVCERCDSKDGYKTLHSGWVVWDDRDGFPTNKYVFKTPGDARVWRKVNGLDNYKIRSVLSNDISVQWYGAKIPVAFTVIQMADRLQPVFNHPVQQGFWLEDM